MMLHCALTYAQSPSDFFVASAAGQIFQHLGFSLGEFRTRHRFGKLQRYLCRKESLSLSNSTHRFPDLLRMCPVIQEASDPAAHRLANVVFALVTGHHNDLRF